MAVLVSFCVGRALDLGACQARARGRGTLLVKKGGADRSKIEGMNHSIKGARPGLTDLDKACPMP